jgi:3'-phosphoadenosine 5'-phosphosulfate (PAPS) 3'-phosphatase
MSLVGSSEGDTAAGQAVLEAASGYVLDWHIGDRFAMEIQGVVILVSFPCDQHIVVQVLN